jgi:hypothetical protein
MRQGECGSWDIAIRCRMSQGQNCHSGSNVQWTLQLVKISLGLSIWVKTSFGHSVGEPHIQALVSDTCFIVRYLMGSVSDQFSMKKVRFQIASVSDKLLRCLSLTRRSYLRTLIDIAASVTLGCVTATDIEMINNTTGPKTSLDFLFKEFSSG